MWLQEGQIPVQTQEWDLKVYCGLYQVCVPGPQQN